MERSRGIYAKKDFGYNTVCESKSDCLFASRARYYNIDIKRFINQDILTGSIDSSKSLNRMRMWKGIQSVIWILLGYNLRIPARFISG